MVPHGLLIAVRKDFAQLGAFRLDLSENDRHYLVQSDKHEHLMD